MTYVSVITINMITMITNSVITNQSWINKYLLHYSLLLKFSQTLYINWVIWGTECGNIYKSSLLKKRTKVVKVYAWLFILNNFHFHIYFIALIQRFILFIWKSLFDCTNLLIETCAMTISLSFENVPSRCCALVILFQFLRGFS